MIDHNTRMGVLFGTAYGDALGAETEFMRYGEILHRYGQLGPATPAVHDWRVTDDTQMTLALAEAIASATRQTAPLMTDLGRSYLLREAVRTEFLAYLDGRYGGHDGRHPGMTVMTSLRRLAGGAPLFRAGDQLSKGCGANMRVAPVALLPWGEMDMIYAARMQAVITHRHPTAVAAAQLTAQAVRALATGCSLSDLLPYLVSECQDWAMATREGAFPRPLQVARMGWFECQDALWSVETALQVDDRYADPCVITGEGWTAEQCLATALACLLLFPGDPVLAIRRAAATGGDSDSIAAITGALAGAAYGFTAWPADWYSKIEFRQELEGATA